MTHNYNLTETLLLVMLGSYRQRWCLIFNLLFSDEQFSLTTYSIDPDKGVTLTFMSPQPSNVIRHTLNWLLTNENDWTPASTHLPIKLRHCHSMLPKFRLFLHPPQASRQVIPVTLNETQLHSFWLRQLYFRKYLVHFPGKWILKENMFSTCINSFSFVHT